MANRKKIYEGKAKILYKGPRPGTLIQYFKDDATAFNNEKQGTITGKGVLNNTISEYLMNRLAEIGIPTHFIERLNMREQLIKEVEIIPIEVVVRNVAAGHHFVASHTRGKVPSVVKLLLLDEGQDENHPTGAIASIGSIGLDINLTFSQVLVTLVLLPFPGK